LQEEGFLTRYPFCPDDTEEREPPSPDNGTADSGAYPFLENEQLYDEYLQARRAGDEKKGGQIQWNIALANQKLLWWFARRLLHKWNPPCLTLQDLVHYGLFGILKAVEKYDPAFETKLSSYAGWWIMRSIESAIFENGSMIRVPEYRINQKAQIDAASLELLERGMEPSLHNIAAELNQREAMRCSGNVERRKSMWTPEVIDEINQAAIHFMSSIDRPLPEGSADGSSAPGMGEHQGLSPEHLSMAPFMRSGFRKILEYSNLSRRDMMMLELYFYGEARSRSEIVRLFGITREAFGEVMDSFEESFPDIFKKVSERSAHMMSILRFCRLPMGSIDIIEQWHADGGQDAAGLARRCGVSENKGTAVIKNFRKLFPDMHAVAHADPDYFQSIIRFARLPRERQTMLGVYFCGDDLSKQDLGILCGVSRERVRQIIGHFTETYKGPLRRLFLREFISAREVCEQFLAQKKEQYAADVETFLLERLAGSAGMLTQYYMQRLGAREIAARTGGLSVSTVGQRLKQAAAKMGTIPAHIAPFFCGGHTSLSPKEMFARQLWGFLPTTVQADFIESLDPEDRVIFTMRLGLDGARAKLKDLMARTGRRSMNEISVVLEKILLNFIDYAGEYLERRRHQ
jgi:RNA polymerase sigma factor (sigma-70 family)